MKSFVACSLSLILIGACSRSSGSRTQGHFEDFSPEALGAYEGRLGFVPEYEPGQNVMVSSEIFELQGHTMLKSIVDAGVNTIYLIPSYREASSPQDPLNAARKTAEETLRGQGTEVDAAVSADLDSIFAHVRMVPRLEPIYVREDGEVYPTVWARDWAPLTARSPEGALRIMDLNYYPDRTWDDVVPASLLTLLKPDRESLERVSLPIYNEGGNFMNTSEWCFMTTRVTEANSAEQVFFTEEDERASNRRVTRDVVLSNEELVSYYNKYGCRQTHIFPRLPNEGTGHIDMWAKLLDERTVLVGDVWDETIATLTEENVAALSKGHKTLPEMKAGLLESQAFLREQQQWFANHGFRVVKVPMPVNLWLFDEDYFVGVQEVLIRRGTSPEEARRRALAWSGSFLTRSYTNSLIANRTVLTPRYQSGEQWTWNPATDVSRHVRFEYPDSSLLARYENTVREAVEGLGLEVQFIETDELISMGGSVHCTTMQTPL